jgi:transcriptional regulator with XRE-family HTH domain
MDDNARTLSAAIGARARSERQAREWTLDQLAQKSGVSRRMLVNVEQGTANPSVTTLLRLSDALGIGLQALVAAPQARPVKVVRAGDAPALWTGAGGGRGVLLAGTTAPDVLELWDWTLEAGEQHVSEPHTPGTQELVHLHAGALGLQIADESVTLRPGDAIAFPGDVEHCYANEGRKPARFTLAVLEPDVDTSTRSESRDA